MFRIGFFESEITPSLGSVIPGDFAARYSQSVRDPLHVRAVVTELDGKTLKSFLKKHSNKRILYT